MSLIRSFTADLLLQLLERRLGQDQLVATQYIMGVEIPDNYPLDGKSLWPYLTTAKTDHHDWVYSYKKEKQLIRGHKVLRDGYGKWWDVSVMPDDHASFPEIKDWGMVSERHHAERDILLKILPKMDLYKTEYDAPEL